MSNIDNVNDIILALDKIDSLYREVNTVNKEIQDLPCQKEKEKSKYQVILDDDAKDFIKKQVKQLPHMYDTIVRSYWMNPPEHWKNSNAKRDKETEKYIEEGLSCEVKEKLYNTFRKYDECFLSAVKECDNQYAKALAHRQSNYDKIEKEYSIKEKDLTDRKVQLEQQLGSITLLPKELFADAKIISTVLKKKRADTLKEAINLALDEKRKDKEELERRMEAARQEAILEQQAQDNRRHNEAMARAAEQEARAMREHNAAMERTAQAQSASQRQANAARCLSCAKSGTCSYERKQANICQAYVRK